MGDTIKEGLGNVVANADDATLAEYVKDTGSLGDAARAELRGRGFDVHYSNTNGVVEGGVLVGTDKEVQTNQYSDTINAPGQTLDQQAESVEQIDPTRVHTLQDAPTPIDAPEEPTVQEDPEQVEDLQEKHRDTVQGDTLQESAAEGE